jgi:hypothetical protein
LTVIRRRRSISREVQDRSRIDIAYEMLRPLKQGKPVVLKVDDPGMLRKKRVTELPLLFLTPETVYRGISPRLVVSLEAHGCEIIDTRQPIKALHLSRVGMSYKVAQQLAMALNKVFDKGER